MVKFLRTEDNRRRRETPNLGFMINKILRSSCLYNFSLTRYFSLNLFLFYNKFTDTLRPLRLNMWKLKKIIFRNGLDLGAFEFLFCNEISTDWIMTENCVHASIITYLKQTEMFVYF